MASRLQGGCRSPRGVAGWLACVISMPSAGYSQRVSAACHHHPVLTSGRRTTRPGGWEVLPVAVVPAAQMVLSPGFIRAVALV